MSFNLPRILNNLSYEINNREELTFLNNDEHKAPTENKIKIYSKTDSNLYKLDSLGNESSISGGSGGITNPYDEKFKATDFQTNNYVSINDEIDIVKFRTRHMFTTEKILIIGAELSLRETVQTTWIPAVLNQNYNDLNPYQVIGFSFIPSVDISIYRFEVPLNGWISTDDKEFGLYENGVRVFYQVVKKNAAQKILTSYYVYLNTSIKLRAGVPYVVAYNRSLQDFVDMDTSNVFSTEITNVITVVQAEAQFLSESPPTQVEKVGRAFYCNFDYVLSNNNIRGLNLINNMFVSGKLYTAISQSIVNFTNNNTSIIPKNICGSKIIPSLNIGDSYKIHITGILSSSTTQKLLLKASVSMVGFQSVSLNMILTLCNAKPFEFELTFITLSSGNYYYHSKFSYTNENGLFINHLFNDFDSTYIPDMNIYAAFGDSSLGNLQCNSVILTKI